MALPGIDSNQKHNFYLGRNYEHFEKRYIQYLEDIKSKLNTKQDNKIQNKFTAQSQYSIQNVCLHFNLIYIEKDNGLIKLQYDIPKPDTQEEREVYYKNKLCKRLEREIADAYKTEDYRIIPDANNRLNILKAEIESINKVLDKNL